MSKSLLTLAAGLIATVLAGVALTAQDRVDMAMVARIRAEATSDPKFSRPSTTSPTSSAPGRPAAARTSRPPTTCARNSTRGA